MYFLGIGLRITSILYNSTSLFLQALEKKVDEEEKRLDERILIELDTCAAEQQTTLEKAGVPGFHRSNDPTECRLQMYLLEFISRLHKNEQAQSSGAGS